MGEQKDMLGFSIYLNHDLTAEDYNYLLAMRNAGLTTVFTSLNIPEDDPAQVLKRLHELTKWCQNLETAIIADVSREGLERLGVAINDVAQLSQLNLSGLRIDAGVNVNTIARLSKEMPIALNASTISEDELAALRVHGANFDHLQAWHNYYPRPETGLASSWLKEKNEWLHQANLKTVAFVAGDSCRRGPIHAGLPTLEKHRNENPLAATLELQKLGCDHVFIGDAALKATTIASFTNYTKKNALTLHLDREVPELLTNEWHNRPDAARDVVRLVEGRKRQLFDVNAQASPKPRPKGSLTCDNERYLRYQGELQITKRDLPADERVNVIANVVSADLALLDQVEAGQELIFTAAK